MQHNIIKVNVAHQNKSLAREPLIASVVTVCHSVCPSLVQAKMVWPYERPSCCYPWRQCVARQRGAFCFNCPFDWASRRMSDRPIWPRSQMARIFADTAGAPYEPWRVLVGRFCPRCWWL